MFLVVKFLEKFSHFSDTISPWSYYFLNFVDASDKTYLIIVMFIMNFFLIKPRGLNLFCNSHFHTQWQDKSHKGN